MSQPTGEASDRDGELFDGAPCGYVVVDRAGLIARANAEFLRLVDLAAHDVVDVRTLHSVLTVGGRILLETHVLPMMEHDGVVREIALELVRPDGRRVPVILNATRSNLADGSLLVVLLATRDRHRYEGDLLESMRDAERARGHADSLAKTLQQTLIPPQPPEIPHLDIDAVYRPAGNGREVGGDFYDVFQVGPDEWFIVLGDVSGKGIPAAVVTTFVRYTLRSLAIVHRDPADVLRLLDTAMAAHETERYCTLVVVRLMRSAGRWDLSISLAGHPPALVRRADGHVYELGVPGTPVGLVSDPDFSTVQLRLDDETVVLYTDGVTEARSADGMYGEERLTSLIRDLPDPPPRAITESVARAALSWQSDVASDDIAVVAFAAR